jgi:hypothetical protein
MGVMIRKIDGTKWNKCDVIKGIGVIPADLITKDLRTKSNTLSLWYADAEVCIEDAVLALVSSCTGIDSIDIVKIDRESIERKNFSLMQTEGNTGYLAYRDKHYDLIKLTYGSLGSFAELILENKATVERIRAARIKSILKSGLTTRKITEADLDPHILKSL